MFKTPKKHLFRTIKQINHTTNKNKLTFKANTVSTVYTRAKLCLDLSFTLNPNGALKPDNPVFPDQLFANVCVCVCAGCLENSLAGQVFSWQKVPNTSFLATAPMPWIDNFVGNNQVQTVKKIIRYNMAIDG